MRTPEGIRVGSSKMSKKPRPPWIGSGAPHRRDGLKPTRKRTTLPCGGLIWAVDLRDQRRLWQHVYPEAGLTLRQAMFFYDEHNLSERFLDLEANGYGGDPPCLVDVDGWPTPEHILSDFQVKSRDMREARLRLEHCLLRRLVIGKLVATGYSSTASSDEPAKLIIPDRWRVLKPDFETSEASSSGLVISGILVFKRRPVSETVPRKAPRFSAAEVRTWYERRVRAHEAAGTAPSREHDVEAARAEFGSTISRDFLRNLRRELAPEDWKRLGRRKSKN